MALALLTTTAPLGVSGVSEVVRPALVLYGKVLMLAVEMTASQMTDGELTPCKMTYACDIVKVSSATLLGVEMIELTFLTGLLLGTLIGGAFCVRYLRREIAANVGPQLRQLNYKIEALESVLNLVLATRHAELTSVTAASTRSDRD
jgi:hypothetical protein